MKTIQTKHGLIKGWIDGVPIDENAIEQASRLADLPFIAGWLALMPDCHLGRGSTVGSVIPTQGAVIPAAVGVDIGCGMAAYQLEYPNTIKPEDIHEIRKEIERLVPHGRTENGGKGDRGAWANPPDDVIEEWQDLIGEDSWIHLQGKYGAGLKANDLVHLGTLGTGNHFIELDVDQNNHLWIMLHSGSRGIGAKLGGFFIEKAKALMEQYFIKLPDPELSYLPQGTDLYNDYLKAVNWAQKFARTNRDLMMLAAMTAVDNVLAGGRESGVADSIQCHHNYIAREKHYGKDILVTRKGAIRAGVGDRGIIPSAMGQPSYLVTGKGDRESFCSASHGAGRVMSRTAAIKTIPLEQHIASLQGIDCDKTSGTLDECQASYKDIDAVIEAERDLIEVTHTLRPLLVVKGIGEERHGKKRK